jgi:multidrug efflux system outer membrane protein
MVFKTFINIVKSNFVYIASALLLVAGCGTWGPQSEHRELEPGVLPESFSEMKEQASQVKTISLPRQWWRVFASDELNTLVATAFTNNLDMAAAAARLRQAHERLIISGAAGRFQLSGNGRASVDKFGNTSGDISVENTTESYSAGLSASYEVDIWGRLSSADRAAELIYEATEQQLNATALLLSGEIARNWLQLKATLQEMELVNAQIDTSLKALDLLNVRQLAGLSAAVDVYQQESQVAALQRLLPALEEQCDDIYIQLNYLLGFPASASMPVEIKSEPLPLLDAIPATGMPADLIVNRPDIQAAWFNLQAQEWSVVSRKADRLPALTLTGNLNFEADEISDVFKNWYVNLAAGLVGPIIDGGRRAAEVRLADAQADEYFIAYTDTVLQAVREVEQSISREKSRRKYLEAIKKEILLSEKTFKESVNRYRKGLMEYLNVLTALSSRQISERRELTAQSSLILNRIALYQALAGRWGLKDEK